MTVTLVARVSYLFDSEYKSCFEVGENTMLYGNFFLSSCSQFEMETSDKKDLNA